MKYYHKLSTLGDGSKWPDPYNLEDLPLNTPIWAFAYVVNDDTTCSRLRCLPVLGEIVPNKNDSFGKFYPYKKGTTELNKSKAVIFRSRMYADTYEEAAEMYNELVNKRRHKLIHELRELENHFIKIKE